MVLLLTQSRLYSFIKGSTVVIPTDAWRRGGSPNVCFGLQNIFQQTYDIIWYIFDLGVFGDVMETPKTDTYSKLIPKQSP